MWTHPKTVSVQRDTQVLSRWFTGKKKKEKEKEKIHLPMKEPQEIWVPSLGREDSEKEGKATRSSILAGIIPWTEAPGGLQSMRSQESRAWPEHTCTRRYIQNDFSRWVVCRTLCQLVLSSNYSGHFKRKLLWRSKVLSVMSLVSSLPISFLW